ncbi:Permeases of the drug/metabolite transporter (DMT) superfamily [Thermococcus nautili]|uniref:EamA family transporter n=1 Tax=Thermococcus nautili TaxID=195522 RepID=UPI002555CC20|nr:EamA family transporter [Thermococcus nautili]CAI1492504.1 Permeases of the drug/metabolite transporter (DMT) superfamily [Thermococcus nautili]
MKRGYLLVFLAASMWGTIGIFATYIYRYNVDSFTMVFWRVLFALIILGTYISLFLRENPFTREKLWFYAVYGLVGVFAFYTLYFYTVKISSVGFAVLLIYTAPAFSVILGRLIFKEPITTEKAIALVMVLAGVLLVAGNVDFNVSHLALLTGIATGFTYALYGVLAKFGVRNERPERVLFMTLLFGLLFLAPFSKFSVPRGAIPYLLGLAFFPTFLGYTLYNHALKEVEVSRASIVATVEPVVAIVLAYILFGEALTPLQLLGGALIIGASILVHMREGKGNQT